MAILIALSVGVQNNLMNLGDRLIEAMAAYRGCQIATGNYTGDGAIEQLITGTVFLPRFVWIGISNAAVVNCAPTWRLDVDIVGLCHTVWAGWVKTGEPTKLHTFIDDGFSAGDTGTDSHPNKLGVEYVYLALG